MSATPIIEGAQEFDRLTSTVRALIKKGDHAKEKSDQFYIAAGQHLKTLKKNYSKDWAEWELLLKEKCKLSTGRASELMQIADGRKTVEGIRAKEAKKHRQLRANKKSSVRTEEVGRHVITVEPDEPDDSEPDCGPQTTGINPPEARLRGLLSRSAEALRLANFDDLDGLEIDVKTHLAVMAAAAAWSQLSVRSGVRTVDGPVRAAPAPAIAPTPSADPGEMPSFLRRTAAAS